MIQTRSFADLLQRAAMGLGGIADSMTETDKANAAIAAQQAATRGTDANTATINASLPGVAADAGMKNLTFAKALDNQQKLAKLQRLTAALPPDAPNSPSIGATAGASALNGPDTGPTPGLGSPGPMQGLGTPGMPPASQPKPQDTPYGSHDETAGLIANLAQGDGKYDMTPAMVRARQQAELTQTQNASTTSNQGVVEGQQKIDLGALGLDTAQKTQGAEIAAKNQDPALGQGKLGLMAGQTNEANAKASEALSHGAKEKSEAVLNPKLTAQESTKQRIYNSHEKPYETKASAFIDAAASMGDKTGASDQALIDNWVKIQTGSSAPTVEQYKQALGSIGLANMVDAFLNHAEGAKLADQKRQELEDNMLKTMKGVHERHMAYRDFTRASASRSGLNADNVTPTNDYEDAVGAYFKPAAAAMTSSSGKTSVIFH